jgi:signal peptidase
MCYRAPPAIAASRGLGQEPDAGGSPGAAPLGSVSHPRARAIGAGALVVLLALAVAMLLPALLGYQRYVITGSSMSGTYDRGSLVWERQVPVSELQVGDVITYQPPRDRAPDGLVTHRIVSVKRDPHQGLVLRTMGDANPAPDPWRFTLASESQSRVEFAFPYLGYAFAALALREVRMVAIGLPALLVALVLLTRLWREAGEESRARRQGPAPIEPAEVEGQ